MRFDRFTRHVRGGSTLGAAIVGGIAGAFAAGHAADAAGAFAAVESAVTCATTTACVVGNNTSTGPGVAGVSKSGIGISATGATVGLVATGVIGAKGTGSTSYGLRGLSTSSYGVFGQSTSGNAGVTGTSPVNGVYGYTTGGAGVYGSSSTGYGLFGTTTGGSGYGVVGSVGGSAIGVYGTSYTGLAVQALSTDGTGLLAETYNGPFALNASAGTGIAVQATNSTGNSNPAVLASNGNGNGGDFRGSYIGVIGRAPASSMDYPFVATDPVGNGLFWVDGAGDVYYAGSLNHFARVNGGSVVKTFSPNTTQPTLEDSGTAQLTAGAAVVRLDPMFSASIDAAASYRVFMTPGGDTHGLYVAAKTPNGFIVREAQGGRSTVSFDYRILATPAGGAGNRIGLARAGAQPHAPAAAVVTVKSTPLRAVPAPHP